MKSPLFTLMAALVTFVALNTPNSLYSGSNDSLPPLTQDQLASEMISAGTMGMQFGILAPIIMIAGGKMLSDSSGFGSVYSSALDKKDSPYIGIAFMGVGALCYAAFIYHRYLFKGYAAEYQKNAAALSKK